MWRRAVRGRRVFRATCLARDVSDKCGFAPSEAFIHEGSWDGVLVVGLRLSAYHNVEWY